MRAILCTTASALLAMLASSPARAVLPGAEDACTAGSLARYATSALLAEVSAPQWLVPSHATPPAEPDSEADPRQLLVDFAMDLRDIRYHRGGRSPRSGFDCSGFVHYVFAQVLGVTLPGNSAAQFADGEAIARTDLQAGDLVFFRTRGKRISHVGIYVGDGRFIHSPTTGERVRVDRMSQNYWARRFAGARRPAALI